MFKKFTSRNCAGNNIARGTGCVLLLGMLCLGAGSVVAQAKDRMAMGPAGFDNCLRSIASIQSTGCDNDQVVIRGRLTNYLYKDIYEFTDETGNSIEIELDDDIDWSPVHKDQLIEIFGELDRNMFRVRIDAEQYRILEQPGAAPTAVTAADAPVPAVPGSDAPVSAAPASQVAEKDIIVPVAAEVKAEQNSETK